MLKFPEILFLLIFLFVQTDTAYPMNDTARFDHTHSAFDGLVKDYVDDGRVEYKGFINSRDDFNGYLKSLGDVTEEQYESWTNKQKLAFWINAYNAFTVKAIIDHYPIRRSFTFIGIFYAPKNSILQIPGVWKKLRFKAVGKDVTLDQIEHEILRVEFNEPRIHSAINCASLGCPDLRDTVYTAEGLDFQLDESSVNFVNDKNKGVWVSPDGKTIKVSKIFKWFGEDFYRSYNSEDFSNRKRRDNGVLGYIVAYTQDEKTRNIIKSNNFKLKHLYYDWTLNEK